MLAQPEPDALGRVGLVRATTLTFYPRYADLYTQLHAESPELQAVAGPESEEDMQGYLEAGQLFEIFVDGAWAGVTAVFRGVNTGLSGFCMAEIALSGAYRGQGLGSAVQLQLVSQLIEGGAHSGDLLFGTIGVVNAPARRTALRAGRADLGGHVWAPC
jgi:GNAT superfamily N-acetyltransferase